MDPAGLVYQRFPARPEQRGYLEHIWLVRAPGFPVPRREILIPNGRPTVVVALADLGIRHDPVDGTSGRNGNMIAGITTRPYVLEQLGPSWYLGAQLTPWGLAALPNTGRLVDRFLPVDAWLGAGQSADLVARLRTTGPDGFADFLAGRARPVGPESLLRAAIDTIEETRGQIAVRTLADRLRISYDVLYRLFRTYLGVSPKQFSEIIRYYHFVGGLLGDRAGDSDALLAGLHGYYDQAHAARDFRRYTGVSASSFKKINNGIARLMHTRFVQDSEATATPG
ncbi:MAG TPA: helix-turn-helix domain-containing protein [Pilimelia sp.]|nr:helix-turn-helix domain-containing protein [Pilimelia sp.]